MLPVLPFLIGGALGTVAGLVLKTYYEERDDEINEKLEDGLMNRAYKRGFFTCKVYSKSLYE